MHPDGHLPYIPYYVDSMLFHPDFIEDELEGSL